MKPGEGEVAITACSLVNIASTQINKKYIKPPEGINLLKSGEKAKSDIQVNYIDFPEKAIEAFEYAVSIWENLISSSVPIKVNAKWENLNGNILAMSRPSTFHANFKGAQYPNVYYPVALAEKLSCKDINAGSPDIICTFNSRYSWYFEVDGNTPTDKYDFVSSVLHELSHGFGIAGFLKDDNGTGLFYSGNSLPSIYDYFIFNTENQKISDKSIFSSPSFELHKQLTSNELKFFQPDDKNGNEYTVDWLYAPAKWLDGASIYHFNLENDNELMTPFAKLGEAIHNPGNATLEILSEIGWKSILFDFTEIKDKEEICDTLPVSIGLISDFEIDSSSVNMIYSFNDFSAADTIILKYNELVDKFYGIVPMNFYVGDFQYIFKAESLDGREFVWPAQGPEVNFKFRIGPDNLAPELLHNPVRIISKSKPIMDFSVTATDNLGVKSVMVEYKLDGTYQEPFYLQNYGADVYQGKINFINDIQNNTSLEYRIIAYDKSSNDNQKVQPSNGFYSVEVYNSLQPVTNYHNEFENTTSDFILSDFTISRVPGFADGILHTRHPYPVSVIEDEKYNLIAQLRYPIIIQKDGIMEFDEVVLVEPEWNDGYTEQLLWDYIIVEGSKDNGITWQPFTPGYDSGDNDSWKSSFNSVMNNGTSVAVGNQSMSLKRTIYLTENNEFSAGDTVIFRFRLASDNTVNGWGWAIDNLEIQNLKTSSNNFLSNNLVKVYPNPFSDQVIVDCSGEKMGILKDIYISDFQGNVILHMSESDLKYDNKFRIDLSHELPGVYFVKIFDESSLYISKIIKYK